MIAGQDDRARSADMHGIESATFATLLDTERSFGTSSETCARSRSALQNGGSRVLAVTSDRDIALQMLESTSDLIANICCQQRRDAVARVSADHPVLHT
jgi:hypothetical protein